MNDAVVPSFIPELASQLRNHLALCQDVLLFAGREHQALAEPGEYQPFEFHQGRKALLLRLDKALNLLRTCRLAWQRLEATERARHSEVKHLLQAVQDSLVKILVIDRENQQALLRRGLVPAGHVPSFASPPPHYAAQLYRRHSS
jgi:hypothetical protein